MHDSVFARQNDSNCKQVDIQTSFLCRKYAFPDAHSVKKSKILSIEQCDPSKTIKKWIYLQHIHPIPHLWVNHQQNLVHLVQFTIYPISTLVQIFDVQLQNITNGIIKHEETGRFLNLVSWFGDIDQIKNWCQYFIHSLDILNLWVELRIDIQNPCHVVISISFLLLFFIHQKCLICLFILSVYHLKFLPSCTGEVRNHHFLALCNKEREFCVSS